MAAAYLDDLFGKSLLRDLVEEAGYPIREHAREVHAKKVEWERRMRELPFCRQAKQCLNVSVTFRDRVVGEHVFVWDLGLQASTLAFWFRQP